jgi:hypothetical protein
VSYVVRIIITLIHNIDCKWENLCLRTCMVLFKNIIWGLDNSSTNLRVQLSRLSKGWFIQCLNKPSEDELWRKRENGKLELENGRWRTVDVDIFFVRNIVWSPEYLHFISLALFLSSLFSNKSTLRYWTKPYKN